MCDAREFRHGTESVGAGEIGWVFALEHGGRGYATEAVRAALSICFERLANEWQA